MNDGLTRVDIEVIAEDGTVKKYCVEITKLSAKIAALSDLALDGDIPRNPAFCTKIYEYNSEYSLHVKLWKSQLKYQNVGTLLHIFIKKYILFATKTYLEKVKHVQ